MFEKVNPSHPDKIADRIAGAIVDCAYARKENPKIAVEVLVGHGSCKIIIETDEMLNQWTIVEHARRISGIEPGGIDVLQVRQDSILAKNQEGGIRCGDNGIFIGMPPHMEETELTEIMKRIYRVIPADGKGILDVVRNELIICQSNAKTELIRAMLGMYRYEKKINPLGEWTGGIGVDAGATNRKLGSDMGAAVTGGGLHGKDLSKADVSVNIYAHIKAGETGVPVSLSCAIGDEEVDGRPYAEIVEIARGYIKGLGGFERFAEWGLIR